MKKTFFLLVVGLTFINSISAQDEKPTKMYFRISQNTVDSATMKNALSIGNGLIFNRYVGGTTAHSLPLTTNYTGKGAEFGVFVKHGGLLQTSAGLSFATLFSGTQQSLDYSKSSITLGSGSSASTINTESASISEYTSNRLQTAKIDVIENIHFLHDSTNPFLKGIGLRAGFEFYGNEARSTSPYYYGTASATSGSTTLTQNFFSATSVEKIKYNEVFLNGVIGLKYTIPIGEKHKIDLGIDYLKSAANRGKYTSTTESLLSFPSSTGTTVFPIPITTKLTGDVKTELVGNRFTIGYSYDATENISFRFSFQSLHSTHKVVDSKVKEPGNILTLFNSGSNILPFLLGSQPGFGPFPTNKDVRTQFGVEVSYKL
ncbi:hypothetical protein [Leptospira sp. 'Mane']|uniref:hypothetical protein n=1 Tax=Leptospira sp. 'Mane' TaxID=3387407 RepID=UPI00398B6C0D